MIIPAQLIRKYRPVDPFCERTVVNGMSFGLSAASYDIRVAEDHMMEPGAFELGSSVERFNMPNNLIGIVHDKSTWARRGLACQNTLIDCGWRGYLTLELTNHSRDVIAIKAGDPIAQIAFHLLAEPSECPYGGKYQDQESGPQSAREESQSERVP